MREKEGRREKRGWEGERREGAECMHTDLVYSDSATLSTSFLSSGFGGFL